MCLFYQICPKGNEDKFACLQVVERKMKTSMLVLQVVQRKMKTSVLVL